MRELFKTGSVTSKQRDDAEARLTVATAQRSAAAEALGKLRRLARPEEIQAAEARLAQARAGADLLAKTIADCTITAPAGGIVTHKAVEAGELVMPGATIVTLADLDSVYVMIYVTELEIGRIKLGGAAEIRIDAFPDRPFPGKITYISPRSRIHAQERPDEGGPGQARLRGQGRDREQGRPPQAGPARRRRRPGRPGGAVGTSRP